MRSWLTRTPPAPSQVPSRQAQGHGPTRPGAGAAALSLAIRPVLETLESRQLLSASAGLVAGTYTGTFKLKEAGHKLPTSTVTLTLGGTDANGGVSGQAAIPGLGTVDVIGNVAGKKVTLAFEGNTPGILIGKVGKKSFKGSVQVGTKEVGKAAFKASTTAAPVTASGIRARAQLSPA